MSDTPRTDALILRHKDSPGSTLWTLSLNLTQLASELERELAEAQRNKAEQARHCQELTAQLIEARRNAMKNCWELVNGHIRTGELPGNGCDETAHRNGLILATNIISLAIDRASTGEAG